jgi:hypothetical protein
MPLSLKFFFGTIVRFETSNRIPSRDFPPDFHPLGFGWAVFLSRPAWLTYRQATSGGTDRDPHAYANTVNQSKA